MIKTEPLGSFDPAVTGDDLVGAVNQNWTEKAEALDAAGNLPNLLQRVAACVALIRNETVRREHFEPPIRNACGAGVARCSTEFFSNFRLGHYSLLFTVRSLYVALNFSRKNQGFFGIFECSPRQRSLFG